MRQLLLVITLLLVPTSLAAEPEELPSPTFIDTLGGVWKGDCTVKRKGQPDLTFPMELHVKAIEGSTARTWQIVYGEGEKRQVRPYEISQVDGDPDHWRIDEKNSILIDAYHVEGRLYSRFWVAESMIDATYARVGETLEISLVTFGAKPQTMSGGKGRVPKVASYELRAVQRAVLRR